MFSVERRFLKQRRYDTSVQILTSLDNTENKLIVQHGKDTSENSKKVKRKSLSLCRIIKYLKSFASESC